MDAGSDEAFARMKEFLENHPPCSQAIKHLKPNVEIGLVIGPTLDCAILHNGGKITVEKRQAKSPDVIFRIAPDSVYVIIQNAGNDIGDLAVAIVKEVVAGSVKISIQGSFFNLMRHGYFDIIKEGGRKLWDVLATKGITNLFRLMELVKSLRK